MKLGRFLGEKVKPGKVSVKLGGVRMKKRNEKNKDFIFVTLNSMEDKFESLFQNNVTSTCHFAVFLFLEENWIKHLQTRAHMCSTHC